MSESSGPAPATWRQSGDYEDIRYDTAEDGYAGIQQLAHDANLLFYASEEAHEGRDAFKEKRPPDFGKFPRRA